MKISNFVSMSNQEFEIFKNYQIAFLARVTKPQSLTESLYWAMAIEMRLPEYI